MEIYLDPISEKEVVVIEIAKGEFTSMLKSTYDEQQAEQSPPMVTDETSTL